MREPGDTADAAPHEETQLQLFPKNRRCAGTQRARRAARERASQLLVQTHPTSGPQNKGFRLPKPLGRSDTEGDLFIAEKNQKERQKCIPDDTMKVIIMLRILNERGSQR